MTKSRLKNLVWESCSIFIRTYYALSDGTVKCYTCDKIAPWQELQAGHGIGGRNNARLYELKLLRPQCLKCNVFLRGNYPIFTRKLIEEYGLEEYKKLANESAKPKDISDQELWDLFLKFSMDKAKQILLRESRKLKNKAAGLERQAARLRKEAQALEEKTLAR